MKTKQLLALSFAMAGLAAVAILILVTMPATVYGAPAEALRSSPGSSGPLIADATWGPGVIIISADVLVSAGTTLDIVPNTTIKMEPFDTLNLGVDPNRIEFLIQGTLQVNGPVTFTSNSAWPTCADWVGIHFQPGSSGYLQGTIVEYGVHAVEISTLNPITVGSSELRYNCHVPQAGNAWGAGMAIYDGTHQVIDTEIHDNLVQAGLGGAWAQGGGVEIEDPAGPSLFQNCKLYFNTALNLEQDAAGGGMNVLGADPIVAGCEIVDNQANANNRAFGGGVNLDNSDAVIADTLIQWNAAGAPNSAYGGGVSIGQAMAPVAVPIIRDSQVISNHVAAQASFGAGIAFYEESWTMAVISDTLIAYNVNTGWAAAGGGIGMAYGATADHFDSNLIHDNLASGGGGGGGGGGICLAYDNPVIVTNNLLFHNTVEDATNGPARGGGIYANSPSSYLINNTVVSNTATAAGQGGGVYLGNGVLFNDVVANNTAGNDGGGVYWAGGTAGYNDAWNNTPNDYAAGGMPRPATDIVADPLFASSGDLATFYHLRYNSPCIDAGTGPGPGIPSKDYDKEARPRVSWDIGFDEVYPPSFTISKQASSNPVVGAPLTYTLTVINSGPGPGTGVLITDALPVGAYYLSGGSYAGGIVSWMVSSIPPSGGSAQVTFAVTTCQTSLTNQWYRVADSTLGVISPWGTPLTTNLAAPTINASFDVDPTLARVGQNVDFTDTSTTDGPAITAWGWDFGDGSTGSGNPITHAYAATGTYTVTLTVTDACGYSDTETVVNAVEVTEQGLLFYLYLPIVIR